MCRTAPLTPPICHCWPSILPQPLHICMAFLTSFPQGLRKGTGRGSPGFRHSSCCCLHSGRALTCPQHSRIVSHSNFMDCPAIHRHIPFGSDCSGHPSVWRSSSQLLPPSKKIYMFFKHGSALIPFNSADSTQLLRANGCCSYCKIAWKYNRSHDGKRTNIFLSTSETSHLSSGLCTESWHQMISFISFTVKLNLSQALNCWEYQWRVSFTLDWKCKRGWLAGLSLSGFNLREAWLERKHTAVAASIGQHEPRQLRRLSASGGPVSPLALHLFTFPQKKH